MIWLAIALLAAVALSPLVWTAWRGGRIRGRRDAAIALHQAQLKELERDLADGRLLDAEYAAARLEVQRRLLGDADLVETQTRRSGPVLLTIIGAMVPGTALILYMTAGNPDYAARARAARETAATAEQGSEKDAAIIEQLRSVLTTMDPKSDRAHEGYLILGRAELARGHLPEAADAWRHALAMKYEPALAAETAEAITEAEGHVTPEAAGLFKRALSDGAPDAPWRKMAEKRAAESGGS